MNNCTFTIELVENFPSSSCSLIRLICVV